MLNNTSTKLLLLLFFYFADPIPNRAYPQNDSLKIIWENENELDSIRFKAINAYYLNHTFAQPDSVLVISDFHYLLATQKGSKKEMANALNEKSYAYYLKGDLNKSKRLLEESIALLRQLDDPITLANVYANMGNIYGEERKYREAIIYFYETLEILKAKNVEKSEARILHNIGLIYYYIDNHDMALEYLTNALGIYKKLGLTKKIGATLLGIGNTYYKQERYKDAIDVGEKALTILQSNNNKFSTADCYFLLAKANRKLLNKAEARYFVDKSLQIDQSINNNSKIIERLIFIADLTLDTNPKLATQKAESILDLLKDDTKNELKANLFELLYKCYKTQKKPDLSLKMHEQYVVYKDSFQIEKDNTAIIREAIKSEFETKLHQSQLSHEKTQAQLKINHLRKTFLLIFIAVLLVAIILLFGRKKVLADRKKREQLLTEIEQLKNQNDSLLTIQPNKFELNRERIEFSIDRKLNETDWNILNILLDDPVISNKEIAQKAFMSIDGIGSALRRMYDYFEIKESKYKKISLLMEAIKLSNN